MANEWREAFEALIYTLVFFFVCLCCLFLTPNDSSQDLCFPNVPCYCCCDCVEDCYDDMEQMSSNLEESTRNCYVEMTKGGTKAATTATISWATFEESIRGRHVEIMSLRREGGTTTTLHVEGSCKLWQKACTTHIRSEPTCLGVSVASFCFLNSSKHQFALPTCAVIRYVEAQYLGRTHQEAMFNSFLISETLLQDARRRWRRCVCCFDQQGVLLFVCVKLTTLRRYR